MSAAPLAVPSTSPVTVAGQPTVTVPIVSWDALAVGAIIGQGGSGVVHEGTWNGEKVAIKCLQVEGANSMAMQAFQRELSMVASLQHESLVQILAICKNVKGQVNQHALVMKHYHQDLLKALAVEPPAALSVQQRFAIAFQVAEALSYLHTLQPAITHGDIKPQNILLTREGRAHLADFGIATVARQTKVTYTQQSRTNLGLNGTPAYMAYELFQNPPQYGPPQDIFAWAAMTVHLFSSQIPWPRMNPFEIIGQLIQGRSPEIPMAVPESLHPILQSCFQNNPMLRPNSRQLVTQLEQLKAQFKASNVRSAECCVCGEIAEIEQGLQCSGADRHFICGQGVDACVFGQVRYALDPVQLRRRQGHMHCPVPNCLALPFTSADRAKMHPNARVLYDQNMEQFMAVLLAPADNEDKPIANVPETANAEAESIQRHRTHIIDEILTLRCPACQAAFVDYDGCDALTCSRCAVAFCALCLLNCGNDAHAHVARTHGQVYGGHENFERVHRLRREALIRVYISNLEPRVARGVIAACWRELQDVGINIEEEAANTMQRLRIVRIPAFQHVEQVIAFILATTVAQRDRIEVAAIAGDASSQFVLAAMFKNGLMMHRFEVEHHSLQTLKKCDNKALEWLQRAADQRFHHALYQLGIFALEGGHGVNQNYNDAMRDFRDAFNLGNSDAAVDISHIYLKGLGFPLSYASGLEWANKAVARGNPRGLTMLASFYRDGLGVKQSKREALRLVQQAADMNSPEGKRVLGILYNGSFEGVVRNPTRGQELAREAAAGGSICSYHTVGKQYQLGKGVEHSILQALEWYRKGVDCGDSDCMAELAVLGSEGVFQSDDAPIKWLQKAAERSNADAQCNLAQLYETGEFGLKKSAQIARQWFMKAAALGNAEAQYNVGLMYLYGEGVGKSMEQAKSWWRRAAEQKFVIAQDALARYANK